MNSLSPFSRSITFIASLFLIAFMFVQCGDSVVDSEQTTTTDNNLVIKMTDAPFPANLVTEANVTIDKIEIRSSSSEEEGNPFITLSEKDTTLNLLDLTNDVTATLVDLEVEADTFDLIRLYVSDASVTVADTAKNDTTTFDLKVPSGAQTGIKIFIDPAVTVGDGLTTELLLDFDVSKSFVMQGNLNTPAGIKGFIFTPVIRAVNQSEAGRISGIVSDEAGDTIEDAEVWVTRADTVFSSTFSDSTGSYALIGLPEGNYDLHGTKSGFDTTSVNDVSVTAGSNTAMDLTLSEQ